MSNFNCIAILLQPVVVKAGRIDLDEHPPSWERNTLFVTDGEIAERLGISEKTWRSAARELKARGLPPKNPLFGNKRYWPAIKNFIDQVNNLGVSHECSPIVGEFWDEPDRFD